MVVLWSVVGDGDDVIFFILLLCKIQNNGNPVFPLPQFFKILFYCFMKFKSLVIILHSFLLINNKNIWLSVVFTLTIN